MTVELGRETLRLHARKARGAERERLWSELIGATGGWSALSAGPAACFG